LRETEFIKKVIANAEEEYLAPDVETRLVIVHNPFTQKIGDPFDIEEEIYTEWARLLGDHVKPHAMLCAHVHKFSVDEPGSKNDALGQPCTVVVGSLRENDVFGGVGFVFGDSEIDLTFTTNEGRVVARDAVKK
jgi:hypothetical protein